MAVVVVRVVGVMMMMMTTAVTMMVPMWAWGRGHGRLRGQIGAVSMAGEDAGCARRPALGTLSTARACNWRHAPSTDGMPPQLREPCPLLLQSPPSPSTSSAPPQHPSDYLLAPTRSLTPFLALSICPPPQAPK